MYVMNRKEEKVQNKHFTSLGLATYVAHVFLNV
jgi:hypothetical protein